MGEKIYIYISFCVSISGKSLATSYVRSETNTDYPDLLSLAPQIPTFPPRVTVLCISAMNTQWHPFSEIPDRRQLPPRLPRPAAISRSRISPPSFSPRMWPILFPSGPRLENHLLFTRSEGLVLAPIVLCPLRGPSARLGGRECLMTCKDV